MTTPSLRRAADPSREPRRGGATVVGACALMGRMQGRRGACAAAAITLVPWLVGQPAAAQASVPQGNTDGNGRMESARLYGNMNKYAYYFTDILIGSPNPQRTSVIVDTGSRLVGFPCGGCEHCGSHLDAAYDVGSSDSARWLPCSGTCGDTCVQGQCMYQETYSEGSTIKGRWFDDLVELGSSYGRNSPVRARMGCHSQENKLFYTQRANGIMGLAPDDKTVNGSRPTILQDLFQDKQHVDSQVFSLCLATWGGKMTVGGYDTSYHQPGASVQWTPMRPSHYYFVFPEVMSLAGQGAGSAATRVAMTNGEFGVTIIDSGTTFTYFPRPVFQQLVSTLSMRCARGACGGARQEGDCWRLSDINAGPAGFPDITIQFRGSATFQWSPQSYLHERGERGVWCQTFMENNLYQTVLGISWMIHKDIIFDIARNRMGVASANCPEHHRESDYLRKNEIIPPRSINGLGAAAPVLRGPRWLHSSGACMLGGIAMVASMGAVAGLAFGRLRPRTLCLSKQLPEPMPQDMLLELSEEEGGGVEAATSSLWA